MAAVSGKEQGAARRPHTKAGRPASIRSAPEMVDRMRRRSFVLTTECMHALLSRSTRLEASNPARHREKFLSAAEESEALLSTEHSDKTKFNESEAEEVELRGLTLAHCRC